jgi:peptide/nickel transport system permease protein
MTIDEVGLADTAAKFEAPKKPSADAAAGGSSARGLVAGIVRRPIALGSAIFLVVVILACLAAPWIAPYNPLHQDLAEAMMLPSRAHILGTDDLGRDVYSRLLYGGQPAFLGVLVGCVACFLVGVPLGLVAGYGGRKLDGTISAVGDLLLSIPSIVVILAILAVFNHNIVAPMATLGILTSGGLLRVVRAVTLEARDQLYVRAAKVSGLGPFRILFRHILPAVTGPALVQLGIFAGVALTLQAGLGFLGLDVPPPAPSWGNMIGEAAQVISNFPWLLVPSGGIVALTILAFGLLSDGFHDTLSNARKTISVGAKRSVRAVREALPDSQNEGTGSDGSASGTPLLEISDLHVSFAAGREAVAGISLTCHEGEIVGLVGESGSGKSVTSLACLGLLPTNATVTAQKLIVNGVDIIGFSERQFRDIRGSEIAYISQEPMSSLDPSFTVGSILREAVRRHEPELDRGQREQRVLQLLAEVQLPAPEVTVRKYPFELSGGMAQRVCIALALAGRPKLLIADEPTTALDVTVQAEILELLRQLREREHLTIVLVTHDLAVVADICERVIVMQSGKVVEQASARDIFRSPQHAYTKSLITATPNILVV